MITDEVAKPSKAALSEVLRSADLLELEIPEPDLSIYDRD